MPATETTLVSAHRLTHLAEELTRYTGNAGAVGRALDAAGLNNSDLGKEGHHIPARDEARFLQEAVTITGDKSFAALAGLHFGRNTGIPSYVAKYSRNLREALLNAGKYTILTDGNFTYQMNVASDAVGIALNARSPHLEFGDRVREFIMFTFIAVIRNATGRELVPLEIRFAHEAPNCQRAIARLAGCDVSFSADQTEIFLAPSLLDLSVPTYDPSLLRYLEDYGTSLVAQLAQPEPGLRTQVEALLIDHLPERLLLAPEVAAKLGMSHRTLTRRLSGDGLSFSVILEELRGNLAKTYLAQSTTPISEIAFLLDYSDQAAFTTAFKRWSGVTPKAFRASAN